MDDRTPAHARVFLARHGQTALNAENRLRGLADPPLDETGLSQATRLSASLAGKGIQRILTSPLRRARDTASAVASGLGIPMIVEPRLNDRDYGPWTGHRKEDVTAEWGSADNAPGVEPVAAVLERSWPVLEELRAGDATTAIVTHDAVIRALVARIMNEEPQLDTRTGCWNELISDADRWTVARLNQCPD